MAKDLRQFRGRDLMAENSRQSITAFTVVENDLKCIRNAPAKVEEKNESRTLSNSAFLDRKKVLFLFLF